MRRESKKAKKMLALMLTAVMLGVFFAGCGGNSSDVNPAGQNSSETEGKENSDETPGEKDVYKRQARGFVDFSVHYCLKIVTF